MDDNPNCPVHTEHRHWCRCTTVTANDQWPRILVEIAHNQEGETNQADETNQGEGQKTTNGATWTVTMPGLDPIQVPSLDDTAWLQLVRDQLDLIASRAGSYVDENNDLIPMIILELRADGSTPYPLIYNFLKVVSAQQVVDATSETLRDPQDGESHPAYIHILYSTTDDD